MRCLGFERRVISGNRRTKEDNGKGGGLDLRRPSLEKVEQLAWGMSSRQRRIEVVQKKNATWL